MVDNTYHRVLPEVPLVGGGQDSYHRVLPMELLVGGGQDSYHKVLPVEPSVGGGRDKARRPRYEQDEKGREQTGQTG